ncbi:ATPase [Brevibacillus laterosporus]
MAVNDTVEIISSSNPDIYGKVATIKDIKSGNEGIDLRIETKDGMEFWIDAEDVVSY